MAVAAITGGSSRIRHTILRHRRLLDDDSREATWGTLLTKADDAARDLGIVLLVTLRRLAAMQIGPHSDLRTNAVESTIDQRSNLLADANLTLLATPKAVLLTSRLNAAIQRNDIRWITPGVLANLVTGPLRDALDAAPDGGVSILHPTVWIWGGTLARGSYRVI